MTHMSSVDMSNHGLSEKSIVALTIHNNARTVTKDLYERSIATLTTHANARTVTNMHIYSSTPCQSIPDRQSYSDSLQSTMDRQPKRDHAYVLY